MVKIPVIPDVDDESTSRALSKIKQWLSDLTAQQPSPSDTGLVTLRAAPNVSVDGKNGTEFRLVLDQNTTIASPTNVSPGQSISVSLIQDATGGRTVAWGSAWIHSGNSTVTSTANGIDLLRGRVEEVDKDNNATLILCKLHKAHS